MGRLGLAVPEDLSGSSFGVAVALNHDDAVHQNGRDAIRKLVRLLVGGSVGDPHRIEHDNVGRESDRESSSMAEPEMFCGE